MASSLSYRHNASAIPLEYKSMIEALDNNADKFPNKEFLVFQTPDQPRVSLTFAQFKNKTTVVAIALRKLGLQAKDKIAVYGRNGLDLPICNIAAVRAGLKVVRLHTSVKSAHTFREIIKLFNVKALVADDITISSELEDWLLENGPEILVFINDMESGRLRNCQRLKVFNLEELCQLVNEDDDLAEHQVSPDHVFTYFTTSGTTGLPKAVPLPHFMWYNNIKIFADQMKITSDDVVFNDRPMSHMGGEIMFGVAIIQGCTNVFTQPQNVIAANTAEFLLRYLQDEKVTQALLFAYLLHDISSYPERNKFDLSNIKVAYTGGQVISQNVLKCAHEHFGTVVNVYGSTECGLIIYGDLNDSDDVRCRYNGKPSPHFEISIRDENDMTLPVGKTGELWLRSYCSIRGYYKNSKKSQESVTTEGWFRTGDFARMNQHGYVNILGRKVELIIRGSINYCPSDLESFLADHPKIANVQVIGVPDQRLGEEICACVVPAQGERLTDEEIMTFTGSSKSIDGLSFSPRYVVRFDAFPKAYTGKIDRKALRTVAMEKLGLSEND